MDYMSVTVTSEMIRRAIERQDKIKFDESRELHRFGSEADRVMEGFIGEEVGVSPFPGAKRFDHPDYDFFYGGLYAEVKTITCSGYPKPHFLAVVNSSKVNGVVRQKADVYIFVRLEISFSKAWIVGGMSCKDFFNKGVFVPKNTSYQGIEFKKANATALTIGELSHIGFLGWWTKE
jgi:hypothetical protein